MKAFLRCVSWFFCQHDDGDDGVLESCKLAFLPDDIIVKILVSLPVKTLLQFKLVCKSWRTLISSPQFAIDNLRQRSGISPRVWSIPVNTTTTPELDSCNSNLCSRNQQSSRNQRIDLLSSVSSK
ncbi:hypothetical protein PIB30_024303 [Stylosanthes scabra]|uniref:F-box domain-containing protein n=1 Tax=Stylosanthes scabra TaxID=79078 RepID=A0ABU6XAM7_9FABA|nr:hypothetical protein [Stylosanthes scabra]